MSGSGGRADRTGTDGQRGEDPRDPEGSADPDPGRPPSGRPEPLPALRGAFTFLTRLPIPGAEPRDWDAFRRSPWTFPVVGAVVGAVAGAAFLLPAWPTAAAAYVVAIYLLTGVTHADGLADVGDAVAAHDPERRRAVMADAGIGVGGALALVLVVGALAFGAVGLATTAAAMGVAVRIVLAAEVGAKLGMATLVCLGEPAHEGLGSQLADAVGPLSLVPAGVVAVPVLLAPPPGALPALVAALLAGPAVALVLLWRTRGWLGGVSGDVFGAANELGRALALHAGVIAWILL